MKPETLLRLRGKLKWSETVSWPPLAAADALQRQEMVLFAVQSEKRSVLFLKESELKPTNREPVLMVSVQSLRLGFILCATATFHCAP